MDTEPTAIVIFPGAGSFGSEFGPLLKAVRPRAHLVRYGWRTRPLDGCDSPSFEQAAQACARQVADTATGPTILVGHSLGAYVAYATAAALQQAGCPAFGVILVGAAAPQRAALAPQLKNEREIEEYWRRVEPGMFERVPEQAWKDIVIETTRCDLVVFERFQHASFGRLRSPVLTAAGRDDPLVGVQDCDGWADVTDGSHEHRVFPGGHSEFLVTEEFIAWIVAATQWMEDAYDVSR